MIWCYKTGGSFQYSTDYVEWMWTKIWFIWWCVVRISVPYLINIWVSSFRVEAFSLCCFHHHIIYFLMYFETTLEWNWYCVVTTLLTYDRWLLLKWIPLFTAYCYFIYNGAAFNVIRALMVNVCWNFCIHQGLVLCPCCVSEKVGITQKGVN